MLLGLYLLLVIALPLALGCFVAFRGLPRSRLCPACASETLRLQSRPLALLRHLPGPREIQSRWCPGCGWQGAARVATLTLPAAPVQPDPAEPHDEPRPHDEWLRSSVEIRHIRVNGDAWRVRVRCWEEGDAWIGRLLFVAPSGRSCIEDDGTLSGASAIAVLSQVLSLSERALAGRIRKATR